MRPPLLTAGSVYTTHKQELLVYFPRSGKVHAKVCDRRTVLLACLPADTFVFADQGFEAAR
jgi:hypothetical protein